MTRDRQGVPTAPPRRLAGRALLGGLAVVAAVAGPLAPPAHAAPIAAAPVTASGGVARLAPVDELTGMDPSRDGQWQLAKLQAQTAWQTSTGRGVIVAVIDSGVDASHPDLAGQVLPGVDLVSSGADGPDPVGHGTTVAGLIAGRRDDDRGAVGLAPDARILPVRVLDQENRYDNAVTVANGVRWAVDHGARVINLSLGGTDTSAPLAAAIDYAFARNVVVVACTGNLATSKGRDVWYPAREPGVLAVTGLDGNDNLWSGAITGHETVLSAPATAIYGARPGGYWLMQGTSFAAPLVAATAALVLAKYPQMSAADVVNRITATARDLGPTGRDDRFGYGMVDPVAALTSDVPSVARNPLDDNGSPGSVGFGWAPGFDPDNQAAAAPGADPLSVAAPEQQTRWAARPAGQVDNTARERLWPGLALFVALVTSAALAVRRFRQSRR
ncbi:type VII secretion-associated serine protease mycosin [Micromonospora chaiyaphumensis]|uniref:type VII secretion-associated serine protease mycosin n=1 Tax=Micromonospora chaiyaphumensis TaxID=307119 RepID=UPI000B832744|nr:type VII secretion-associated serine protease mycosin [Micromonospora chaiyaphumensis]